VFGEGALEAPAGRALPATYQLSVYRQWHERDGALTPGDFVIEGHVVAPPEDLRSVLFTETPLTLRLEDGRRVRLFVVSEDGAVAGADALGLEENRE
jgi:hypothetical protein